MIRLIRSHLKGAALVAGIFAPLFMLLEVFMDLQQPTLMSNIIDIGVATGDMDYVLATGGRMMLFAVLGLAGGVGSAICATYAAAHMAGAVRRTLFHKIFALSDAEVDDLETPALITRLTSDVTQVQEMMMMLLRSIFRAPFLFLGGIVMAFLLSPRLALILLAILPLLLLCAVLIILRAVPMYTGVQQRMDRVNTVMRESLLGVRVVKAFTLEERQIDQFEQANENFAQDSIRAQKTTFLLMPIVTLVMNLSVVAVLWFGGLMEINGYLPMGRIMAFVNYMVQITNALVQLVNLSINISRSKASSNRILETLDTPVSVGEPERPVTPEGGDIVLDHVSFRYSGGGEPVLRDISLRIPRGRRVGIIGATGCGKSTLAALIARQYDPEAGTVSIGGVDVRDIPLAVMRKTVGVVAQESLLFSGTVAQNLRFGDEDAGDEDLWRACRAAEAEDFIRALSDGLEAQVSQRGKNFSGGQKQRMSIARSLVHGPEILILDDSTSAVDLLTEARLQQAIRSRRTEGTLILIAQRISSIMDCDEILVMEGGRIAARGTHDELMERSDIYRDIALSQLGEEVQYA